MPLLLLLAATASGVAALAAEVVWFRALGRGVGTSAEALSVVSASFLGGLGIGAAIASRLASRTTFPFRAAAVCEAMAGILVFLSPAALAIVPDAHLAVLHALGLSPGPSAWPAALVAGPVLVLPTAFLGATLPFLVRARLSHVGHAGRWTGWLYAVNTIGAAGGVVLAVFFLLERFGEATSLRIAGGGNLLASLLILLAERPVPAAEPPAPEAAAAAPRPAHAAGLPILPSGPPPAGAPPASTVGFALFLSGALALGAEVAWFRLLEPITGVHLYGFAVLLGAVLFGTALGGAIGGVVADRSRRPDLALATAVGVGALLVIASVTVAGAVPWLGLSTASRAAAAVPAANSAAPTADELKERAAVAAAVLMQVKLLVSALCVAAPLVALAAAYPLGVKTLARSTSRAAGAAGSVYAWNTAGNVVGSVLAGFVLLPRLGGPATLVLLGGLGLAFSAALRLSAPRPRSALAAAVPLVPLALLAFPVVRDAVLESGPRLPEVVVANQVSPRDYTIRRPADVPALAEVVVGDYPRPSGRPDLPPVRPREGLVGSVGLLDERGTVRLRQGGLSESRFAADDPDQGSETEVGLALIPYLLHPAPKTALCIGHGAGWTCETLLAAPDLERVDVAEIEAAVLDVVAAYRGPLEVRRNPKARLHVADGRLLLREAASRGGTYDLVVSQPSHPWVPGAGHLFTSDAYALARRALRPGGVFAQWLNLFDSDVGLFRTSIASFRSAFPDGWAFKYRDEVVLVGFTGPPKADPARIEAAWEAGPLERRASAAGIRGPEDVWKRFTADGPGLARLAEGARPAGDDDPRIELGCAWLRFTGAPRGTQGIYDALHAVFPPDLKAAWSDPAARLRWVPAVVRRLVDDGSLDDAERWDDRISLESTPAAKRARARLFAALAARDANRRDLLLRRAEDLLRAAVPETSDDAGPAVDLLEFLDHQGRADDLARDGVAFAARFPEDGRVLALAARGLVSSGEGARAEELFHRALAARVRPPRGTGWELARLLLAASPPRKEKALEVLRAHGPLADDREALLTWKELEIELGDAEAPEQGSPQEGVDGLLAAFDRRRGHERLRVARDKVASGRTDGLAAATEATQLLPDLPLAWRLRGWYELWSKDPTAAGASLAKAVALSKEPAAERARRNAYFRLFGFPLQVPEGER